MNFEQPQNIIDIINSKLEKLNSTMRYRRCPKDIPEYQILKGKKVVYVDDLRGLVEAFLPTLVVATDGFAEAIVQKNVNFEDLLDEILKLNPDIVLMDRNLDGFTGSEVIRALKRERPDLKCVGFSSMENVTHEMTDAGAFVCIEKEAFDPEGCITKLAKSLS